MYIIKGNSDFKRKAPPENHVELTVWNYDGYIHKSWI